MSAEAPTAKDKGAAALHAAPDAAVIEALANAGVDIEGVTPEIKTRTQNPLVRGIEFVTSAFGIVAALLLLAATVVVCQMIFVRSVLGWSTIWQTDFVIYSATAAIFIGAAYVLSQKGHVGVDFIQSTLRGGVRRFVDRAAMLMGLIFCAVMTYASWHYFHEALTQGWRTETVWAIPLWIPTLPLPLGFALLCLQYVAEFIKYEGPRP
jgi:TRAP-type C4-dicarboxylate transport system permease small subunit